MKPWRGPLLALCTVALAACVSVPMGGGVAPGALSGEALAAAMARQQARETRLHGVPMLAFSGRVALSNGSKGGSGRIEWRQAGDAYEVTLSAPVTRQSWRLVGDALQARIEGLEGGPREEGDVERLLREATGLEIPVGALAAWASGARADAARFGPARLQFDAGGRLARIEQDGWRIDYLGWRDGVDADGLPLPMPDRIDAQRPPAKVRLAIDAWSWSESSRE